MKFFVSQRGAKDEEGITRPIERSDHYRPEIYRRRFFSVKSPAGSLSSCIRSLLVFHGREKVFHCKMDDSRNRNSWPFLIEENELVFHPFSRRVPSWPVQRSWAGNQRDATFLFFLQAFASLLMKGSRVVAGACHWRQPRARGRPAKDKESAT